MTSNKARPDWRALAEHVEASTEPHNQCDFRYAANQIRSLGAALENMEAAKRHYHNRACDIADQRDRAESALAATRAELEGVRVEMREAVADLDRLRVGVWMVLVGVIDEDMMDKAKAELAAAGVSYAAIERAALRPAAEPEVKP